MRGDQLARQWRVRRAIEASPNGLMVAEIARPQGAHWLHGRETHEKPIPITGIGLFL